MGATDMKGKYLLTLCAVIALFLARETSAADRVDEPADSQCLPTVVYSKTVDFFQLRANQKYEDSKLEIKRSPEDAMFFGVRPDTCRYDIGLYGKDENAGWMPLWSKSIPGPGMLFYDGTWHKQKAAKKWPNPDTQSEIYLDAVNILPTEHKQLLIKCTHNSASGKHTAIGIYYFSNQLAFSQNLILAFADNGDLEYKIQGHDLYISGCWHTCKTTKAVTLRFDETVHQFAIINPTKESEDFYKYIQKSEFTL
jgi:hypothetical protein